jgi:hypothetical protein
LAWNLAGGPDGDNPEPGEAEAAGVRPVRSESDTEQGYVETAFLPDGRVAVRDRSGPALVYTPREWDAFIKGAKDGEFDLP